MREHKKRPRHRAEKQMYWFDITWGNFLQGIFLHGNGQKCMVPIEEKKRIVHPPNQMQISSGRGELMEYTNKQDKNGNEICEADILHYTSREGYTSSGFYFVEWNEKDCAFVCERSNPYNFLHPDLQDECAIVGDTYEKMELIEK